MMEKSQLHVLIIVSVSLIIIISPSMAEIKTLKIESDSRALILFEKFGFTPRGSVTISLSDVSLAAAPSDPSLLGFFLVTDESLLQALYDSQVNQSPNPDLSLCVLFSPYVRLLFTFRDLNLTSYSSSFSIARPDEYSLFFANCAAAQQQPPLLVSMSVRTEMFNSRPDGSRDYLSVGQSPVPTLYALFSLLYLTFLSIYTYFGLFKNRIAAHRIHFLMALLLFVKSLNLVFAAEDQHYIRLTGTPHGWDVLFYIFQFLRGVLLFTVIVLVGTGWSFLKPFLQDREKKVLMLVIPLQLLANVASVVIGETGPFIKDWITWNQAFLIVDVVCCCAVLFPILWSIRALRETSKTDGKAARNLAKLTLFRKFYLVLVGYLYFTRIIVFALRTITAYKYRWVSVAAEEAANLTFYIFMFYMFRPAERNQYFALHDDEEEEAAQAVLREEEFEL